MTFRFAPWRRILLLAGLVPALGLALAAAAVPAHAQIGSDRYSAIVVDANSGAVLMAANADEYRFPASLTKMMTLYMVFEALRDRRVTFSQYVPVSPDAASMSPTKLGLVPGSLITVEQAILGLVTKSANDAAAALGEMLAGDEDRFGQMMTLRARALGMVNTTFRNASGLPDPYQVSTARDMATLARHLLQDFPTYYHYFSTPSFVFAGRVIHNHQRLLTSYPGADGFKTGYTQAAGYNVVTSALRGESRLIGVTMGASSGGERDTHMAMLLDQGFDRLGVPGVYAARAAPFRLPSIIGTAQAAPVPPRFAAPRFTSPAAPVMALPAYVAAPPPRQALRPTRALPIRQPAARPAILRPREQAPQPRPTRTATSHSGWRAPG